MKDTQNEILRRSFAAGGLGAIAMAMAGDLSAQGDPGNVQAVRDFHKALETVVAGGLENFAKVTTRILWCGPQVSGRHPSWDARPPTIDGCSS